MWWGLLLSCVLASGTHAFQPAPIRWGGHLGKKILLASTGSLGRFATPQQLTVKEAFGRTPYNEVPYFTTNPDNTISCNQDDMRWCLEASGIERGHVVRANHCTGGSNQKWKWLSWGPIQLEGTNQCIHVKENGGLTRAMVELSECANKTTETWAFDHSTPSPAWSFLQSRASPYFFISVAVMLVSLSLRAWLWWCQQEAPMVVASTSSVPLNFDQGGICISATMSMRLGDAPLAAGQNLCADRSSSRFDTTNIAMKLSAAGSISMVRSWSELSQQAGPVNERPFEAKYRLFGSPQPDIIFWRDNSAWCPYCSKIWLLLELMEVPYQMNTVPLRGYMARSETKDPTFLAMIRSGIVPALQFRCPDGSFADAVPQSTNQLFQELEKRYPEQYPMGDPEKYQLVCGRGGVVGRFELARKAFEACAGAPCKSGGLFGRGLREACVALDGVLQASGGPFVNGAQLTVPDCQLLPLLERVQATVPYFFGRSVLQTEVPFERVRHMLESARAHSFFGEIASDATTLGRTNVCYAPPGFNADADMAAEMDGLAKHVAARWLQNARDDFGARQDAAARMAHNSAAIIDFALRSSSRGFKRFDRSDSLGVVPAETEPQHAASLDFALRAVTESLLSDASLSQLADDMRSYASACHDKYGTDAARATSDSLRAFASFIGVPRDMREASARALRSHLRTLSSSIQEVDTERRCG